MNGNLAQIIGCKQNSGRLHEWDEENRLRFVLGEKFTGYYGYNADGERVYKLTGQSILGQVNSGSIKAQAIFDDAVLYPNPYVVVTSKGYTKHYYAGTERIATVIGTGGFDDMVTTIDKLSSPHDQNIIKTFYSYYQNYDPFFYQKIVSQPGKTEDIFGKPSSDLDYQCQPTELVMVDILNPPDILLKSISINEQNNGPEKEVYFYHGDHLGSANWITDYTGAPVQYIHYAPYGELIDNQAPYLYDERYKFTGKERDQETGYDFFGARYLSSILSHWLSVDPLADKYPNISPYAYCSWNPVKFVDPDGRYFEGANEETAQKIETKVRLLIKGTEDGDRKRELRKTLKDIKVMRKDKKHEFRFESSMNDEHMISHTKDANGHQVITMFSNIDELDGTTAHEARHGGQIARGEIFYDDKGNIHNYGVRKEIDAYKAEWAWEKELRLPVRILIQGKYLPDNKVIDYSDIDRDLINNLVYSLYPTNVNFLKPIYPPQNISIKEWNGH